jgi:hypothetical protein
VGIGVSAGGGESINGTKIRAETAEQQQVEGHHAP